MNIKEIIGNSGLLEDYVLEQLSDTEKQGVECLAKTYPEIQVEIEALRHSLGRFYGAQEKQPPAFLKDKIFAQMTFAEPIVAETGAEKVVVAEVLPEKAFVSEILPEKTGRVIPMWSKMAVAASVLLGLSTVFMMFKNQKQGQDQVVLNERVRALEQSENENMGMLDQFQNPDNKVIKLLGTEKQASSAVAVFWNQKDNSVRLSVKNLPKPAAGKQYQLWYIGEKGPVDMGMLDNNFEGRLLSMKNVNGKPATFAITLEKEGGVPSPTLEQLYVIGNV